MNIRVPNARNAQLMKTCRIRPYRRSGEGGSGPVGPPPIGSANLIGWIDASDGSQYVLSAGDVIETATNGIGSWTRNSRSSAGPVYLPDGAWQTAGQPAIHCVTGGQGLFLDGSENTNTWDISVVSLGERGSNNRTRITRALAVDNVDPRDTNAVAWDVNGVPIPDATEGIVPLRTSIVSRSLSSVGASTEAAIGNNVTSGNRAMNDEFFMESLVYDAVPSVEDIQILQDYLAAKWDTRTGSMPLIQDGLVFHWDARRETIADLQPDNTFTTQQFQFGRVDWRQVFGSGTLTHNPTGIGGRPAVNFALRGLQYDILDPSGPSNLSQFSCVVIERTDGRDAVNSQAGLINLGNSIDSSLGAGTDTGIYLWEGIGSIGNLIWPTGSPTVWTVAVDLNGAVEGIIHAVNGDRYIGDNTDIAGGVTTGTTIDIGRGDNLPENSNVAEVLIYNRQLSQAEVDAIHLEYGNRYGFDGTAQYLPSGILSSRLLTIGARGNLRGFGTRGADYGDLDPVDVGPWTFEEIRGNVANDQISIRLDQFGLNNFFDLKIRYGVGLQEETTPLAFNGRRRWVGNDPDFVNWLNTNQGQTLRILIDAVV